MRRHIEAELPYHVRVMERTFQLTRRQSLSMSAYDCGMRRIKEAKGRNGSIDA